MTGTFDKAHANANGYTRANWDDAASPELPDAALDAARPFEQALPEIAEKLRGRGRPPLDTPKVPVSIRLDADLVKALKSSGPGWQTRANDMLREAAGLGAPDTRP